MVSIKTLFKYYALYSGLSVTLSAMAMAMEVGGDYGKEFRGNASLEQHEVYIREYLPMRRQFDCGLMILPSIEIDMALITEVESENKPTARLSIMPEIIVNLHQNIYFLMGLGAGRMFGNTEFTKHNLGGEVLFASKLGFQFQIDQHWSIGYFYYHQSNAGMYDYNASLRICKIITWPFMMDMLYWLHGYRIGNQGTFPKS